MTQSDWLLLLQYDAGELSEEQATAFFQRLIDSGDAWRLPGSYGRTARWLIEEGLCCCGPAPVLDYYGNRVPSRFELRDREPGSLAYWLRHQLALGNPQRTEESPEVLGTDYPSGLS